MKSQKQIFRPLFFLFLLTCLLSGLVGVVRVPVNAAPMMQTDFDLALEMTVINATPNKTDNVIFTITVRHVAGIDVATGVTVEDILPPGVTYVSDSGAGTYNNTTGIWVVGAVGVGGSVTLNITALATTTGLKTNSAQLLTSDTNLLNNSASADVIPRSAALSLLMTVNNNTPSIGDIVIFTITASNAGPNGATGVRVNDLLPAGLTYISHVSSSGAYSSSTGNWNVGNLAVTTPTNNNDKTLTISASVTTNTAKTNYAEVTESDQLDPNSISGNNSITEDDDASQVLNAPVGADLSLTMTVNNATPNKADNVVLTITVTNGGTGNATGVTVKDLLPAGLAYISDNGGGAYNSATGIWSVGSLLSSGVGSSNTLNITARATTTGPKNNVAEVWTSNQPDPDSTPGNTVSGEDDYFSIQITPNAADLSLAKTVDKSAPNVGDTVKFTITVSNAGPVVATGVFVLDLLPAGFSFVSDDGGGAYINGTGIWNVGSIAVSSSKTLNINAVAIANPNKTNKAEISASDQLDPDSTPGNASIGEDDDDAAPKVDLSLTKTTNNSVPALGNNLVFTIKVKNEGPGSASGVTVRDLLPSGLSYVSDDGGGTYNSSTGIWTVGALAANGVSKILNITTKATAIGSKINSAEIWTSDQFDIDSIPGDGSTTTDDDESVSVTISYAFLSVIINEVAWMGTAASTDDEWIELYNTGSSSINLSGWTLKAIDGTPTISLSGTIPPGGYFLLERTNDTTVSDIVADLIYTGELGNTNETLQLLDPLNRVIDVANSNGASWPAGSATTFGSMERRGLMTDSDAAWLTNTGVVWNGKDAGIPNDCTTTNPPCLTPPKALRGTPKNKNWAASVTAVPPVPSPVPTPFRTSTPVPPPPPPLIGINEFVPRPGHDWNNDGVINVGDEYIELINHGVINVNLSGYSLDDEANVGSSPYRLPAVTLKPGERMVFYGADTGLLLSDGGDGVRLLKPNGQLGDAYNYSVVKYPDQAYCRLPDNGGLDDWNQDCFPTPGLKNSLNGNFPKPPIGEDVDQSSSCPISDVLPVDFVWAECPSFGNIWSRFYWDVGGWFGEKNIPDIDSKWDVYVD